MPPSILLRALEDVYGRVDALGVTPAVAGGLAVAYWGHPRSTQAIDLAVVVSDHESFEAGLRQGQLTPAKQGHMVDLGFVRVSQWLYVLEDEFIDCKIDFLVSNSSYHQTAIGRASQCEIPGVGKPMRVLSCEDLMIFKAAAGRLIDLADLKMLYDLHQQSLDFAYLHEQSEKLGLAAEFWLR